MSCSVTAIALKHTLGNASFKITPNNAVELATNVIKCYEMLLSLMEEKVAQLCASKKCDQLAPNICTHTSDYSGVVNKRGCV